eukprot:CAMPEP_0181434594 /NCGR_PEP_ID=MMETSP1110-20121109/19898_1 /TAXON_ID=174948 /ORGANISM="Symbiodinium sp., Strain CCMP421" /LENGTH=242 /DNA_ID=CAMNT_0023558103 /DNA_START=38 /DNA_END=762 /DNA_ORIENTATION=+
MAAKTSAVILATGGLAAATAFVAPRGGAGTPQLRSTRHAEATGAATSSSALRSSAPAAALMAVAAAGVRKASQAAGKTGKSAVTLRAFENELGVQAPVGFWDPAGFTSDGDAKDFYRRRVVEIKHGRVSMLACTGYIVQEFVRFPGFLSPSSDIKFADVPNGLKAVTVVPAVGWFQYTVFCGLCDLWIADQRPTNPPGKLQTRLFGDEALNYDYGFLGIPAYLGGKPVEDPELKKKKLNAEL